MKLALVTLALALAPFSTVAIPPAIQLLLCRQKFSSPGNSSDRHNTPKRKLSEQEARASVTQPKEKT